MRLGTIHITSRALPVLIWFSALAASAVLIVDQSKTVRLMGIAQCDEQVINSVETGYISSLPVKLFQEVKAGQTLAVVKENSTAKETFLNENISALRKTQEAELSRLRAELTAAQEVLQNQETESNIDYFSMERTYVIDLENARLNTLDVRSELEPAKLKLKDLEVEIEIVKNLLTQQAAEEYELEKVTAQYAVLESEITQLEKQLQTAQDNQEAAQVRLDELKHNYPVRPVSIDKQLAPIRQAITVQECKINELMTEQNVIVLKAPFDGIVSSLDYKPGQTVLRGDSIMTIVKTSPDVITAWIPQEQIDQFNVHTKVEISSLGNKPGQVFKSHVSNIDVALREMPQRLWDHPEQPKWGRAMLIPVQPGFICLHNEIVGIRIAD